MGARLGLVKPLALTPGSTLGLCAPAGPVPDGVVETAHAWFESRGFRVRCAPHLHERRGYMAGTDQQRLCDLLELVRDPEVGAILAARGGYGLTRILGRIDPDELRRARKLLIGYSEVTALSLWLYRCAGLASIHGPMPHRSDVTDDAVERLVALACGKPEGQAPLSGESLRGGRASGPLLGGNLKLLTASIGTSWEIDTRGAVLFLEDVGEQPYALDRALVQLRDAGKLRELAGVAIGQLVNCESERYPEISACEVMREVLVPEVEGPVVGGLPFGHIADNRALGFGARAELDGERGTLTLLDPVVEDGV